jgi:hypothetical protein
MFKFKFVWNNRVRKINSSQHGDKDIRIIETWLREANTMFRYEKALRECRAMSTRS